MDLLVEPGWCIEEPDELLARVRASFTYGPGEVRATGQLYAAGEQDWVPALAVRGPELLDDLARFGRFTIVAFQAYRDGAGCDWHADSPFDAQAVLSLGVTRMFGVRPLGGGDATWTPVAHGDLVFMPSGFQDRWQHCVPVEDVAGERVSLVFRTPVR